MKFLLVHDKPNCIGCGACAAIAPQCWDMDPEGKSSIIGGAKLQDGTEEKMIGQSELEQNKGAAQSCPVNVIHITSDKGEKII